MIIIWLKIFVNLIYRRNGTIKKTSVLRWLSVHRMGITLTQINCDVDDFLLALDQ